MYKFDLNKTFQKELPETNCKTNAEYKTLPRTEFQVMKFIWSKNSEKVSSKEIVNFMNYNYKWLQGTTSKVLGRLVQKKFLKFEKNAKSTLFYLNLVST